VTDLFKDIADFHKKFDLTPNEKPDHLEIQLGIFRTDFMREEIDEYENAAYEDDLEEEFDALIDLVYVALGTAYLHGFDFNEGWKRVHEANMKKVKAQNKRESKRNSVHDVVKPEGWVAPDLSDLCK